MIIKTNIIWISDIHLRASYKNLDGVNHTYFKLNKVVDSFIISLKEINTINPIDYIYFSGDLTFSGTDEDYDFFNLLFIDKLGLEFSNAKLLCIPGNHDISRLFDEFHMLDIVRSDVLFGNDLSKLKTAFTPYQKFYNNYIFKCSGGIKEVVDENKNASKIKANNYNQHLEYSKEYILEGLYGYVIDHEKKVVFTLLNSAWFSYGDHYDKKILDNKNVIIAGEFAKIDRNTSAEDLKIRKQTIEKTIADALNDKSNNTEFGNQYVGQEIIKNMQVNDIYNKYPSYFKIISMHHPLHWLHWNEYYSQNNFLKQIIEKSNLLLTGHEHLPAIIPGKLIFENTFHLEAGAFTVDNLDCLNPYNDNRFSHLEILKDDEDSKVIEHKYLLKLLDEARTIDDYRNFNCVWEKNSQESEFEFCNSFLPLEDHRKNYLFINISNINLSWLSKKITLQEKPNLKWEICNEIFIGDRSLKISEFNSNTFLVFTSSSNTLYSELVNSPESFLKFLLTKKDSNKVYVIFLWLDFILLPNKAELYTNIFENTANNSSKKNNFTKAIFDEILLESELLFNQFRGKFINVIENKIKLIEEDSSSEKNGLQDLYLLITNKLCFVNETISYWHAYDNMIDKGNSENST